MRKDSGVNGKTRQAQGEFVLANKIFNAHVQSHGLVWFFWK